MLFHQLYLLILLLSVCSAYPNFVSAHNDSNSEELMDKECISSCVKSVNETFQEFKQNIKSVEAEEIANDTFEVVHPIPLNYKCCQEYSASVMLSMYNLLSGHNKNRNTRLSFDYEVNMSKENQQKKSEYAKQFGKAKGEMIKIVRLYNLTILSADIQDQIKKILPKKGKEDKSIIKKYPMSNSSTSELLDRITDAYGHAKACLNQSQCLEVGEKGVENFFQSNHDYDDLSKAWKGWRDVTGNVTKSIYAEYVEVHNYGVKENGFPNAGYFEYYNDMKDKHFPQTAKKLYDEILPLYKEIHAYVRQKLLKIYPGRFKEDGPIPAHILGNVWGQRWSSITDLVKPYKNAPSGSITEKLESMRKAQKIDPKKMFKMADEFYISLGMPRMTEAFWNKSVIEKPKNTVTDCHGTAFDMSDGKDFRIKMCTSFTHEDFKTIHHEMGHIQYYMAYASQPYVYRASACHGFHEAIGDTIALSVNTPEHLHEVGLLDSIPNTQEFDINYLLQVALEKVVFLPYSFVLDSWRWAVYNSSIGPDNYNKHWWKLRSEFQGLMPPVARKKEDCDPLAKYHVATDRSYIKYFVSHLVQFQFFEALCKESGNTKPLHRCDFYKKKVGPKLLSMLKLGSSKSWEDALETLTGSRTIETKALLNYFKPLYDWLKKENKKNGAYVGWEIPNLDVE